MDDAGRRKLAIKTVQGARRFVGKIEVAGDEVVILVLQGPMLEVAVRVGSLTINWRMRKSKVFVRRKVGTWVDDGALESSVLLGRNNL